MSHGASWWYGGSLDEVALFSTDQSANISTIYNSGKPADLILLSIKFSNTGSKATAEVIGTVEFYDMHGKLAKHVDLSFNDGLDVRQFKVWEGAVGSNMLAESDRKLRLTDLVNLTTRWVPKKIVHTDGTVVE